MNDAAAPPLSVLDFVGIEHGESASEAIRGAVGIAQAVERAGYRRYWVSEHHNMRSLACSAPELLVAHGGARTERIRVGAAGIMLPNHASFKVAYARSAEFRAGQRDDGRMVVGEAKQVVAPPARAEGRRRGRRGRGRHTGPGPGAAHREPRAGRCRLARGGLTPGAVGRGPRWTPGR